MTDIIPSLDDPLMKVAQVAKIFSVSQFTVRSWCRDGTLKAIKFGRDGAWRIQKSEMIRYANIRFGEKK